MPLSSSMPIVTDEQFIDALKAVVAENPEHVYTAPEHMMTENTSPSTCFYVHTDPENPDELSPGCVVGAALHRLGVPLEQIRKREFTNARVALDYLLPRLSGVTKDYARDVQAQQDQKKTWAESLAWADKYSSVA
jgi:hypothetical protein